MAGLSETNRTLLARMHRGLDGPFDAGAAAAVAGIEPARAARLLRHLAAQGWLTRVRRGMYATVPLEAERPEDWRVDPWVIVDAALGEGYVGGWTALHHWDLTDQVFATTVYLTTRRVSYREREIGGARFELRHIGGDHRFGTKRVWRGRVPVDVSDPERTLVDCLDDPSIGGGVRHVAEALGEYAGGDRVGWARVVDYGDRLGNRTVFKRLGLIAEELDLPNADALLDACRERVSAGIGRLDPGRPAGGPVVRRWGLRRNASVGA